MTTPFNIFHVKVDRVTFESAWQKVRAYMHDGRTHTIVTPNPEIVLKAENDHAYREALNCADLRLPDGEGIVIASRLLNTPIFERVTGVDMLEKLLDYAANHGHSIYVLLSDTGLSRSTAISSFLEKRYPTLQFHCHEASKRYMQSGHVIDDINTAAPDILLVTHGAPFQELWMHKNAGKLKRTNILFAVGGAMDMLSGAIVRAPRWIRTLKLEWLWRMIRQPKNKLHRIRRIYNAVIVFGSKVIILKLRTMFVYRKNVLALVYSSKDSFLVLHKAGYDGEHHNAQGHWALPQGGMDTGESATHAVLRELREETGIHAISHILAARKKNRYRWSQFHRNIYSHRYTGQKQKAFFLRYSGDKTDVRLNFIGNENFDAYRWVSQKELLTLLEPSRRPFAKKLLLEFNARNVYTKS